MTELNDSLTAKYSELDASNTAPSPDGWPNGSLFNQVEPIGRSTLGAVKRFWNRINGKITTTGAAGTYVYTPINTTYPTNYIQGERYSFYAHQNSIGGDTLNINALGATALYKDTTAGTVAIAANDIITGQFVEVAYNGVYLVVLNPTALSGSYAPVANPVFVGAANLSGAASTNRLWGVLTATAQRWTWGANAATETGTGNDSGSDFTINRYSDTGTFIDSPMVISRFSGIAQFSAAPIGVTVASTDKSTTLATTAQVASQPGAAKAWVNFVVGGTTVTIQNSYGVLSVVRGGTGIYTINFNSGTWTSATYVMAGNCQRSSTNSDLILGIQYNVALSTTSIEVTFTHASNAAAEDPALAMLVFFGT